MMPGGFCLVFNEYTDREGSDHDVQYIKDTMAVMKVDCEVVALVNNQETDYSTCIKDAYREHNENLRAALFVIIFYMAHGQNDGRSSEFKYIKNMVFKPLLVIPELDGKLKWIILQTCRGFKKVIPASTDGKTAYYPNYYVISTPVPEGTGALRGSSGSPYISLICQHLRQYRVETLKQMLENIAETDNLQESSYDDNFANKDYSFETNSFAEIQRRN